MTTSDRTEWTPAQRAKPEDTRGARLLRRWRRHAGLTAKGAAEALGVDSLAPFERQGVEPPSELLDRCADLYGVHQHALTGRNGNETSHDRLTDGRPMGSGSIRRDDRQAIGNLHDRLVTLNDELEPGHDGRRRGTLATLRDGDAGTLGRAVAWMLQPDGPAPKARRTEREWFERVRTMCELAGIHVALIMTKGTDDGTDDEGDATWTHVTWALPNVTAIGVRQPVPAGTRYDRTIIGGAADVLTGPTEACGGTVRTWSMRLDDVAERATDELRRLGLAPANVTIDRGEATGRTVSRPKGTSRPRHELGSGLTDLAKHIERGGTNMRRAAYVLGCGLAEIRNA